MLAKVPAKRNDGKTSFKSLGKYVCERDHIDPETGENIPLSMLDRNQLLRH